MVFWLNPSHIVYIEKIKKIKIRIIIIIRNIHSFMSPCLLGERAKRMKNIQKEINNARGL
jgi:hypothetical protein